jgi:hypothetical protein
MYIYDDVEIVDRNWATYSLDMEMAESDLLRLIGDVIFALELRV